MGYKSEESRVLWPNILEKDKELTYNQNEFVLIKDNLLYTIGFHFLLYLLVCKVLTKSVVLNSCTFLFPDEHSFFYVSQLPLKFQVGHQN